MRPGIKRFHIIQLLVIGLISLAFFVLSGKKAGISSLLGGMVAFIPSVVFAKKLFFHQGARAAQQIVKSFYVGEALKLFLSLVLFTLVFITYSVYAPAFFVTYIAVVMLHWLTPVIITQST